MKKRALVLALALTLPLALYGIPYAYAASVGQTTIVFNDHTITGTDSFPIHLFVTCPAGDYATGGGAGHDLDTTDLAATLSSPAIGSAPDFGPTTPDGWFASFNGNAPTSTFAGGIVEVFAVCQAPITVAGIGVPQFGSLYIAIALGAAVYFMLSRQFARRPKISTQVQAR